MKEIVEEYIYLLTINMANDAIMDSLVVQD